GSLDEVSLYNRALSATEIAGIYAAGSGGKCKGAGGLAMKSLQIAPSGNGPVLLVLLPSGLAPLILRPDSAALQSYATLPNLTCRIDASTDLISWTTVTNIPDANGTVEFTDQDAAKYSQRFYRAVWVP